MQYKSLLVAELDWVFDWLLDQAFKLSVGVSSTPHPQESMLNLHRGKDSMEDILQIHPCTLHS